MTTSTPSSRLSTGIGVALSTAAIAATVASAAGEPKNQAPFTNAVAGRALTQGIAGSHGSVSQSIQGEAKSQAPFTRAAGSRLSVAIVLGGEPKNQSPFTSR